MLPYSAYDMLFEPLRGKRLGYVRSIANNIGNVGDLLIELGLQQLIEHYRLSMTTLEDFALPADGLDVVLCSGGGNFGNLYPVERQRREQALAMGRPVVVLPQSGRGLDEYEYPYHRVFFRERSSFPCWSKPELAPDLALCVKAGLFPPPERDSGVFLRADSEQTNQQHPDNLGDPVGMAATPLEYIQLAARYAHVTTNRLHFAVAALIAGRRVTLLKNAYHKNRSMYETWLGAFGAEWGE